MSDITRGDERRETSDRDPVSSIHYKNGRADRKDRIEMILTKSGKFGGDEQEEVQAWRRLCRELGHLTEPEAKMPRFNALLHAVWIAASNDQT